MKFLVISASGDLLKVWFPSVVGKPGYMGYKENTEGSVFRQLVEEVVSKDDVIEYVDLPKLTDSYEMTDENRKTIMDIITTNEFGADVFLVAHGGGTMDQTAQYFIDNMPVGFDKHLCFVSSESPACVWTDKSDNNEAYNQLEAAVYYLYENEDTYAIGVCKKDAIAQSYESVVA